MLLAGVGTFGQTERSGTMIFEALKMVAQQGLEMTTSLFPLRIKRHVADDGNF
jgi:hypothetical protein